MNRFSRLFKSKPIGFIIISACVFIVLVMVASLLTATFSGFTTGINEAVSVQTRELSTQIVYNYENYIGSIITTSNIIQTDIALFDITSPQGGGLFGEYLAEIIHLKNDILNISVYDYDTSRCLSSSDTTEIGETLSTGGAVWYSEALRDPTVHVFSVPYADFGSEEYKVNVSKLIELGETGRTGVLKIEISFQSFIDLVAKSNLGEGGHITIIDSDYEIVYNSLSEPRTDAEAGVIRNLVLGAQNAVLGKNQMAINMDTLSGTKWRICVFINIDEPMNIQYRFLLITVLVSAIVLAAAIWLFMAVARVITTPLKQLELAMKKVEQSDYFRMEEVDLLASSEVEALTKRFNRMMRKIGELMENVIAEQNAQRKSELKALQNQINPHFLYNTLDSILWMIENQRNREAGEMLVALARLFRIGVSNGNEVIPVRDEIEHVRNYLLIQSIRYADSFEYVFETNPEALEAKTMKLILQPIVENCIYHGLKNKIDKGRIRISISRDEEFLFLRVSDNGYGMRQEKIEALYQSFEDGVESNSVGLKNIFQRVMIFYGGRAEMRIESELDEGTTITIKEPLNKE